MEPNENALVMLNVYEVSEPGGNRHYLGFVDPILAGAQGLDESWLVGDFEPGPNREFDPASFRLNPAFVAALARYMNEEAADSPGFREQARSNAGGWLYVLDPRFHLPPGTEPPVAELLGCFAVDKSGAIVPGSFVYNEEHDWFAPDSGVSGVLSDRRFYDWLHPTPGA